ncbi:ROX3 [Candida jiufengensis]|uniref:ROX3 n=1 Tax=Candida jiufengensis TaxID=497108 RepID=UPI0022248386|nr:ROX3 [Candida jiufengensis]KAI5956820.1 ROX3 [Candida jiufengensis]
MSKEEPNSLDNFYLIDQTKIYKPSNPTPLKNLLHQYQLLDLAQSLSRTNPDGSKNVKLRKSYKAHIQDLPGKHSIPQPISKQQQIDLFQSLRDPLLSQKPNIPELDLTLLNKALKFDKTPINGIPGFNVIDLAINDQSSLMRGEFYDDDYNNGEGSDDRNKKRKKNKQGGGNEFKKQHV